MRIDLVHLLSTFTRSYLTGIIISSKFKVHVMSPRGIQ